MLSMVYGGSQLIFGAVAGGLATVGEVALGPGFDGFGAVGWVETTGAVAVDDGRALGVGGGAVDTNGCGASSVGAGVVFALAVPSVFSLCPEAELVAEGALRVPR